MQIKQTKLYKTWYTASHIEQVKYGGMHISS